MRQLRQGGLALLILAVALAPWTGRTPAQPASSDKIAVQPVTYEGLGKLVRGLRGKVIVVDFWADFCPPCKREFPHLVELHNKYGKDGFVAVSVSLDDPASAEKRAAVERFLTRQQAHCTNLILEARPAEWQKALGIEGPPCVYVFNRDNHFVMKLAGDQVDYKRIEAEVVRLLKH